MSKAELIAKLERYQQLEVLLNATEGLAHIGHYEWDYEKGYLRHCSEEYARLFGMTVEEAMETQSNWEKLLLQIHPEDHKIYHESSKLLRDTRSVDTKYRILRKDGEIRHIREIGVIVVDKDNQTLSSFGIVQDISEQEKHERDLEYRDMLAQQAEEITDIGYFIFDLVNETYHYISPGFARVHGVTCEEYIQSVNSREDDIADVHVEDYERLAKVYKCHRDEGTSFSVDYRIRRADGEIRWIREMSRVHSKTNGKNQQSIGVLQDITSQKNAEAEILTAKNLLEDTVEKRTQELAETVLRLQDEIFERENIASELKFLANHDALTGLPSLRLCKDRLERSLIESRRNNRMSAVMFVDLDLFKEVNDSYGHEFGDAVLKVTADRIQAEIREADTVARIGGDEFIVIMSNIPDLDIVEKVAGNLIEQISQIIQLDNNAVKIGASLGIALYPEDGNTPEELIRQADRAMYGVKASGKNSFGYLQCAAVQKLTGK